MNRFNPILASDNLKQSFIDYIATSFDIADPYYAQKLREELEQDGFVAKGPYLDVSGSFKAGKSLTELMDEGVASKLFSQLEPIDEKDREIKLERPLYLHQEQALRKANEGNNLVVTTGTGSGKTECFLIPIVNALLREQEQGTLADSGVRAIIIYPMNALANDQIKRMRNLLRNYPDITFGLYNGNTKHTQKEALAEYRKIHAKDDNFTKEPLENELISRETMQQTPPHILITNYSMLEYMLLRPKDDKVFSIVIDEGQDFQDEHLQLLHAIARSKNGCFYVFYDKNQFVQGVNYAQWLDQMECRLVLSRNCRNTKEIAITSTRPIGLEESRIKMRREFDSFSTWKPKLFFVDGKTTLQEYLAKLIKKYTAAGIKEKDIVVLSMKPEGKSMLQQSDLCISGKYILSREPKENSIFFTTVRKFKGLEAEVIICIDIDKETFSSPQERNVFYVGTSRAMAYLDLLSLSSPEELATAIDGGEIYSKRPQAIKAVRDCLKVKIASAFDLTDDMDS